MTGLLVWSSRGGGDHQHDRIVFHLEGGNLSYRNMRRFGGVWLATSLQAREEITGPLGPDALDVDADELAELLDGRRGAIKPRCGAHLKRERIGGRTTVWCPKCQRS